MSAEFLGQALMIGAESWRRFKHGEPLAVRSQLRQLGTLAVRAAVVKGPRWLAERIEIDPESAHPRLRR